MDGRSPHHLDPSRQIFATERLVVSYEEATDKARQDLAILKGAFALFQLEGGKAPEFAHGVGIRNLFGRGQVWEICHAALKEAPDGLNTRTLGIHCLKARGLDPENAVMRRAMIADVINLMRKRQRRYMVTRTEDRERSAVWRLVEGGETDAPSVRAAGD